MVLEALRRGLEVAWPLTALVIYLWLAGSPWRAAIERMRGTRPSLTLTMLMGIALTTLMIATSYALGFKLTWVMPTLALVGIGTATVQGFFKWRRGDVNSVALQAKHWLRQPTLWLALSVLVVFSPVLRFGATFWTLDATDFIPYVSYTQAWLNETPSGADFVSVHQDALGRSFAAAADIDKPIVTALLVAASQVSRMESFQLQTPLLMLIAFLTVSAMAELIGAKFGMSPRNATVIAMIPGLSALAVTRFLNGQLGHVLALALTVGALALLVGRGTREYGGTRLLDVSIGFLFGAAVGANPPVALSAMPTITMLIVVFLVDSKSSLRQSIWTLTTILATAVVVNGLLVGRYATSWTQSTTGVAGNTLPIPSPIAALGQQVSLDATPPLGQVGWSWALAFGALFLMLRSLDASRRILFFTLAVTSTAATSVGLVMLKVGAENYAAGKLAVFLVVLITPLAIATVTVRLRSGTRLPWWPILALAVSSIVFATAAVRSVWIVVPRDLIALNENSVLATIPSLNVDLGNYYEDYLASLVVPTRRVTVVAVADQAPAGNWWLIRSDRDMTNEWVEVVPLNSFYSLARSA